MADVKQQHEYWGRKEHYKNVAEGWGKALDEGRIPEDMRSIVNIMRALYLHAPEVFDGCLYVNSEGSLVMESSPTVGQTFGGEVIEDRGIATMGSVKSYKDEQEPVCFSFRRRGLLEDVDEYQGELQKAYKQWEDGVIEKEKALDSEVKKLQYNFENKRIAEWYVLWQFKGMSDAEIAKWELEVREYFTDSNTVGRARRRFAKKVKASLRKPAKVGRPKRG